MGWIGAKLVKIYTQEDTDYFYLHDETAGRLFEFQFGAASDEKAKFRYDHVVDDYRHWKQSLPLDNSDIGNIA
nr:hypothetical protein [uncultured Dyadobacter sp.]